MNKVLVALASMATLGAFAANVNFIPTSGTADLSDPANWDAALGESDTAVFSNGEGVTATGTLATGAMLFNPGLYFLEDVGITLGGIFTVGGGDQGANVSLSGTLAASQIVTPESKSNASLTIDGKDTSVVLAGKFDIGPTGTNCTMTVSGGASLKIGANSNIGNDNNYNTVIVDGAGSKIWSEIGKARIYVGGKGSYNKLIVRNGGLVDNPGGNYTQFYVGGGDNSTGNEAIVKDAGSKILAGDVQLAWGEKSTSNYLTVEDGGLLLVTNLATICKKATATGNEIRIRNGGSLVLTNATSTKAFYVTVNYPGNALRVTGAKSRALLSGVKLVSGGEFIVEDGAAVTNLLGGCAIADNNANGGKFTVSGGTYYDSGASGTSIWVGNNLGANATLLVEKGGQVISPGFIDIGGYSATATNNWVIVDGEGSRLYVNGGNAGIRAGNNQAHHNGVIVRNKGLLEINGGSEFARTSGYANGLIVLDGGMVTNRTANQTLMFPRNDDTVATSNCYMTVGNGIVIWKGTIKFSQKGRLDLQGTNGVVTATTLQFKHDSGIVFYPPVDGAETCTAASANFLTTDGSMFVKVDPESARLCSKAGGGRYTIATFANSTLDLDSIKVDAPKNVTVYLSDDKKSLKARVSPDGFICIIR